MNYADPNGRVPLARIAIKGHNVWQGEHPLAKGAYKLDYVADEAYEVTPLHQGFADAANKFPATGLSKWEVNVTQDVKGIAFRLFGLTEGRTYVDYDLIYIHDGIRQRAAPRRGFPAQLRGAASGGCPAGSGATAQDHGGAERHRHPHHCLPRLRAARELAGRITWNRSTISSPLTATGH